MPFRKISQSKRVYFEACKPIIYFTNVQALIIDAKITLPNIGYDRAKTY